MASADLVSPPLSHPYNPRCPLGFSATADQLLNQLCVVCEGLLGFPWGNYGDNHLLLHRHFHPHQQFFKFSRTPQLSALGFTSLLLGISSTLIFLGSFVFLLGLMLMPFILPLAFVVSIGVLLASFKTPLLEFCSLFPSSSASSSNDPIMRAKLGF